MAKLGTTILVSKVTNATKVEGDESTNITNCFSSGLNALWSEEMKESRLPGMVDDVYSRWLRWQWRCLWDRI